MHKLNFIKKNRITLYLQTFWLLILAIMMNSVSVVFAADALPTQSTTVSKKTAKNLAQEAMTFYQNNNFIKSADLFKQAHDLEPLNQDYYYKYGVSLFRLQKFDEALFALKSTGSDPATDLERKYYIGMIYFKKNEFQPAQKYFQSVFESNHPVLAPSSAFYCGVIDIALQNYTKAQTYFEYVIDNSKDPALDKKSEEYLEKISNLIRAQKEANSRWQIHAATGPSYDSNILYIPDNNSSTGTPSNQGGFRWSFSGDTDYRIMVHENSGLAANLTASYIRSFSTDFVQADPYDVVFTLPYFESETFNKTSSKLSITPGFETVYMQYDTGSNEVLEVVNSSILNTDFSLTLSEDWISSYALNLKYDDSQIPSTVIQNADAFFYSFKKSETLILNPEKTKVSGFYASYSLNSAKGDEKKYNRLELGASYSAPLFLYPKTNWNLSLTAYLQNFNKSVELRKDTNFTLQTGFKKSINDRWSWGTSGLYSNNASNVSAFQYSKFTIMSQLYYSWNN